MRYSDFEIYCAICGKVTTYLDSWSGGFKSGIAVCGKECYETALMKNAKLVVGKEKQASIPILVKAV